MKRLENISYRSEVRKSDADAVREIVEATGFFNSEEIAIAQELVLERMFRGEESGYYFLFGETDGRVVAYTCYGPIFGTASSFDLFWIAVHPDFKGRGIGREMLLKSEDIMTDMGCTRVYAETSTQSLYDPTRAFYRAMGYIEEAIIKDFYAPGDSKSIFVKVLSS